MVNNAEKDVIDIPKNAEGTPIMMLDDMCTSEEALLIRYRGDLNIESAASCRLVHAYVVTK